MYQATVLAVLLYEADKCTFKTPHVRFLTVFHNNVSELSWALPNMSNRNDLLRQQYYLIGLVLISYSA